MIGPGLKRTSPATTAEIGAVTTRAIDATTTSKARFANLDYGRCRRCKMHKNHDGGRQRSGARPNAYSKKPATVAPFKPASRVPSNTFSPASGRVHAGPPASEDPTPPTALR